MKGLLKIREAGELIGRSPTWLRAAEHDGRIPKAKRDSNNWRYYSPEDIKELRAVLLGQSEDEKDTK